MSGGMGSLAVKLLLGWLAVSATAMAGMTAFLFLTSGSTRRPTAGRAGEAGGARVFPFESRRLYEPRSPGDLVEIPSLFLRRSPPPPDLIRGPLPEPASPVEPPGAASLPRQDDAALIERLLVDVKLPSGLVYAAPPTPGQDLDHDRLAFITTEASARELAEAISEELAEAGFEVEPLSAHEARAHRDDAELAVTIYTEPRSVIRDRRPAFPGAAKGAAAVEFSVVDARR
ncbi:MAG: hypothetical protein ACKVWR_22040 [Acidimicrobiales bacterium]